MSPLPDAISLQAPADPVEPSDAARVDEEEAFEAAFQAELVDFHLSLGEGDSVRLLTHLGTLRAMADGDDPSAPAASLRREIHASCVGKARRWVEAKTHQLVAEFHLRWREDADMLAMDSALHDGFELLHAAAPELGGLEVCGEVLAACEAQLLSRLRATVKRSNRHELRMLYCDFCSIGRRRGVLQELCLEKYREQVDKFVQTEAVAAQRKLQALLAAAASAAVGGGGVAAQVAALQTADGAELASVRLIHDYLEAVAGLHEELTSAEMPTHFVYRVLREVEQEACTQLVELVSQVLTLDDALAAGADEVSRADRQRRDPTRATVEQSAAVAAAVGMLDLRLEEASGVLHLLRTFSWWCDDLPPPPPPPLAAAPPPPPLDERVAELSLSEVGHAAAAAAAACYVALDPHGLPGDGQPPAAAAPPAAAPPRPPPPPLSEGRRRLEAFAQGLACNYLQAEVAYITAAVRSATANDGTDSTDGETLSLLFDSFFVMVKTFQRSVRTAQATLVVVPLLNHLVDIIREMVLPVLSQRLGAAGPAEPTNKRFLVAANTVQCAHEYTDKLCAVVTDAFASDFPEISGVADMCISELRSLSEECTVMADRAMRQLAFAMIPTTWLLLDFGPADFVVSSDEAEAELEHSFEERLLRPLHSSLLSMGEHLRAPCLEALVRSAAAALAEALEGALLSKRFNEMGVIILGDHVRKLCDSLSSLIDGSVRNEFSRLNHIAFLLNASSVGEAVSLIVSGESGGSERLSHGEAARVLELRVEFSASEVRDLLPES